MEEEYRERRVFTYRNFLKVLLFFLIFVPGTIPALIIAVATIILFVIDPRGILLRQFIISLNNYLRSDHTLEMQTALVVFIISSSVFFTFLHIYDEFRKK